MFATRTALAVLAALTLLPQVSAAAEGVRLRTHSGQEIGLTFGHYQYKEPDLMKLEGNKFGIDYTTTLMLDDAEQWFMRVTGRYATGQVNYDSNGSGSMKDVDDWYTEIRGLFGKDIDLGNQLFAPFSGLGYRYLDNDLVGLTTTGHAGYSRTTNYVYLPIGTLHRIALSDTSLLESSFEFDYLIYGKQKSYYSDMIGYNGITAASTVENRQNDGYGFRLSSFYRQGPWSVGPYFNYWKISKSDVSTTAIIQGSTGQYYAVTEPKNNTYEYGIKGGYSF